MQGTFLLFRCRHIYIIISSRGNRNVHHSVVHRGSIFFILYSYMCVCMFTFAYLHGFYFQRPLEIETMLSLSWWCKLSQNDMRKYLTLGAGYLRMRRIRRIKNQAMFYHLGWVSNTECRTVRHSMLGSVGQRRYHLHSMLFCKAAATS